MKEQVLITDISVVEAVGNSVVINASSPAKPIKKGDTLQKGDVLLIGEDAKVMVQYGAKAEIFTQNCAVCVASVGPEQSSLLASSNLSASLELQDHPSQYSEQDIAAVQQAISRGADPSEVLDFLASGNNNVDAQNSANGGFVSVEMNRAETRPETGFETDGVDITGENLADDSLTINFAEGGGEINTAVVEGSLTTNTYPQTTVGSVVVEQATFALDPDTFTVVPLDVDAVLAELNAHISSGGEAVSFVYDEGLNALVGTLNGLEVISFTIAETVLDSGIELNVTTLVSQPIDHVDVNGQYVSIANDQLSVNFAITGEDISGFELIDPVQFSVVVSDGDNAVIDAVVSDEIESNGASVNAISGELYQLGSDGLDTIVFDAESLALFDGLLSNNSQTQVQLSDDGTTLTVVLRDDPSSKVFEITLDRNGGYSLQAFQAIEQNSLETLSVALPVTVTDNDGDITKGFLTLGLTDGNDLTINSVIAPTANEDEIGATSPSSSGDIGLIQGSDNVESITIAPSVLLDSAWNQLTSNGEATGLRLEESTVQQNGVGDLVKDKLVVYLESDPSSVVLEVVVNVDGTYQVYLKQALDQDSQNLTSLDVPVIAVDTDGDSKQETISLEIADGSDPTGQDSLLDYIEIEDEFSTSREIVFTQGSDKIADISFEASVVDDATWQGIVSNGEQTSVTFVDNKTIQVNTVNGDPVLLVTIDNTGKYTLTQYRAIEQDTDVLNLIIPTTATDTDGDSVTQNITITVRDNISPTGDPSEVSYTETGSVGQANQGQIDFSVFSDAIETVQFLPSSIVAPIWADLTSNGEETSVSLSSDGTVLTVSTATQDVLIVSIGVDGSYSIVQNAGLDHPSAGDLSDNLLVLPINVLATDYDGDTASNVVSINITDGADPQAANSSIQYIELGEIVRTVSAQVVITKGSDAIDTVVIDPEIINDPDWLGITSGDLDTELRVDGNALTVYYLDAGNNEVQVLNVSIALDGTYTVVQSKPIDQDPTTDSILLDIPVLVTDTDQDTANANISLTIIDGAPPLVSDKTIAFTEKATEQSFYDQFLIVVADDPIETVVFNVDALNADPIWDGLVSNDLPLSFSLSNNDTLLTLYVTGDTSNKVLEVELEDLAGNFRVTQFQALDHSVLETLLLDLRVDVFDTDALDSEPQIANISIEITDGDNATITPSTAPLSTETGQEITISGTVNVQQGSDDVFSVVFDKTSIENDTDWTGLLSNNSNLEVSVTGNNLIVYVSGDSSNLVLEASINADGGYTVTQYQALEHNGTDSISLTLPVIVTDTDNDSVFTDISLQIEDGDDPVIVNANVELFDDATDTPTAATGNVGLAVGSDVIESMNVTLTDAELAAWSNIKSNGQATTLEVASGQLLLTLDDGTEVLKLEIGLDGQYSVTQFLPIDQPASNQNLLSVTVTATDADQDADSSVISITINDGVDPTSTASVSTPLDENDINDPDQVAKTGNIGLTDGVDDFASVVFNASAEQDATWLALRSDNQATEVKLSDDGTTLVVHLQGDETAIVLTATINFDGSYSIQQLRALEQNIDSNVNDLTLQVDATDTDGDVTSTTISVPVTDGADPSIVNDSITVEEDQIGDPDIQPQQGDLGLVKGTDLVESVVIDDSVLTNLDWTSITSNGNGVTLELSSTNQLNVDDTLLISRADNDAPVLKIIVNIDGTYSIELFEPIDQLGDQLNGDSVTLSLPVSANDADGDSSQANIIVTVNDGADPSGVDSIVNLQETTGVVSEGNQIVFIAGSEDIADISFDPDVVLDSVWNGLQTNGEGVTVALTDSKTLVVSSVSGAEVLKVVIDNEGNYLVTQFKPIEQDSTTDLTKLILPVIASDSDGDSGTADITINITDNIAPSAPLSPIAYIETGESGQSNTGNILFTPGSDAVETLVIDDSVESDAIWGALTSNGVATDLTLDATGKVLTLSTSSGVDVLVLTLADDGSYSLVQNAALDQFAASDISELLVPVIATDYDQDSNSANISIKITDGDNATVEASSISLDEDGVAIITATDTGSINLQKGSDAIKSVEFTLSDAQQTAWESLTSNGQDTQLVITSNGLTVQLTDGTPVLTLTIDISGSYTVTQLQALDQTADVNALQVGVAVTDTDLDVVATTIDITINDGDEFALSVDEALWNEDSIGDALVLPITGSLGYQGSDAISSVALELSPEQLSAWQSITSNGEATVLTITDTGITVTTLGGDDVLVISVDTDGTYTLNQLAAIDQDENDALNPDTLVLDVGVAVTDTDGDVTRAPISFSIGDGTDPVIVNDIADLLENDIGDVTKLPFAGDLSLDAGSDAVVSIAINEDVVALDSPWQDLTSNGLATNVALSSTHQSGINDTLTVSLADGTVVMKVIVGIDGLYSIDLREPLDQDINNLTELSIAVDVKDSDLDVSSATITVKVTDGTDPKGDDSDITLNEISGVQSDSGQIDFVAGSEDIQSLSFNPDVALDATWNGLLSEGLATDVVLSNSNKTLTVIVDGDPDQKVLEVTIDDDGEYVVTQFKPIEQDTLSNLTELILPVLAKDSDGDSGTANINIKINDAGNPVGTDINVNFKEEGLPLEISDQQIVFTPASDSIETYQLDASSIAVDAWNNLTSNGAATSVSISGNTLSVILADGSDAVVLQLVLADDGSFSVKQNLPLDQDVTSNVNELSVSVIATDFDGDSDSADIKLKITDGIDPKILDATLNFVEVIDGSSFTGTMTINKGIDDIASVKFADLAADSPWHSITSDAQPTDLTINSDKTEITVYKDGDLSQLVLVVKIAADGTYTITEYDAVDQPVDGPLALELDVVVTDTDLDVDTGTLKLNIFDGADPVVLDGAIDIVEISGEQTFYESFVITQGTDEIVAVTFGDSIETATEWTGLVSNDLATSVAVTNSPNNNLPGNTLITVYIGNDPTNKVLEVEILDLEGNYRVTQFQALDHESLEKLLLDIPIFVEDSDDQTDPVEAKIALTISDGDDPVLSSDTQAWNEDDIGVAFPIFSDLNLVTGSDDISSVRFELTTDQRSALENLTSNDLATDVVVTDKSIVVSQSGQDVLVVTLKDDGSYSIEQKRPLDQDATDKTNLVFDVVVADSDGDDNIDPITNRPPSVIDITITDGSVIESDDAALAWDEDDIGIAGYEVEGDLNYQGSDAIDSAVINLTTAQLTAWQAITVNGQSTTLEQTDQALIVRSAGVVALQLTLNSDGTFKLEQFLAVDQANSGGDETSLSAGVLFTDTDGDTANSTITVTIDDGTDIKSSDVIEGWNEDERGTDTQPIEGDIGLTLGADVLASLDFVFNAAQQTQWQSITSNGRATSLVVNERSIEVFDGTTLVLSMSMDIAGNYNIEQFAAIDQSADNDLLELSVGVSAIDADGDETLSEIELKIEDGADIGLIEDTVVVNDNALDSTPSEGDLSFIAGSDELVNLAYNLTTAQNTSLDALTSNGKATSFTITEDNTLITVSLTQAPNTPVMTIKLNQDGTYVVDQIQAIDQTASNDKYILNLNVDATDTDGDVTSANAIVTIEDGDDLTFTDAAISLQWNENNITGGVDFPVTGDVGLTQGADAIASVMFSLSSSQQSAWDGLTSNGIKTKVVISDDGQTFSLVTDDTNLTPVFVGTIDIDGKYSFEQLQALDQVASDDFNRLGVTVEATDSDNDTVTKEISINIEDGTDPTSDDQVTAVDENLILDPDADPVTGSVDLVKGIDAVATVKFDASLSTDLAWGSLLSNNQAVGLLLSTDGTTFTVHIAGDTRDVVLVASINLDGSYSIEQLQALEQDNSALDINDLTLIVNATDTDGDVSTAEINLKIADGTDPQVNVVPAVTLAESSIDQGDTGVPPIQGGKDPDANLESASSSVTYLQGSDDVEAFYLDTANVSATFADGSGDVALTYQGQPITFIVVAGGYMGVASVNGQQLDILSIQINNDLTSADFGQFDFELIRSIDHPISGPDTNPDSADTLNIVLPIYVQDMDGDNSPTKDLVVSVADDVPEVIEKSFTVTEGDASSTINVLQQSGLETQGADDGALTQIQIGGTVISIDPSGGFQSFNLYSDGSDPANPIDADSLMGVLEVHPDGRIRFTAEDDVKQIGDSVAIDVQVTATDGDGDTSTKAINIQVDDITSQITSTGASGSEDAGRSVTQNDTNAQDNLPVGDAPIKVNISVNTDDFDNNEQLGAITVKGVDATQGDFYYFNGANYVALTVNGSEVTLSKDQLMVSTLDNENWNVENLFFVPARNQGSEGTDYTYDISVEVYRNNALSETLDGSLDVEVKAIADSATWEPSAGNFEVTVDEDGDDAILQILAQTQDQDGSETITYEVSFVEELGHQLLIDGVVQTPNGFGLFIISADDIGKVTVNPTDNWSGTISVKVVAITTESDANALVPEARSEERFFSIKVNPIADDGAMVLTRIQLEEDTTTTLDQHIKLSPSQDLDGSEQLLVQISGLADSNGNLATLTWLGDPADNPITEISTGVYEIPYDMLSQVQFTPYLNSNVDFNMTVVGIIRDFAQQLENIDETTGTGTSVTVSNDKIIDSRQLVVDLKGVADFPMINIDGLGDTWQPTFDGEGNAIGVETLIDENTDVPLNFKVFSGELADTPLDDSESVTVLISNIPDGVKVLDSENNEVYLLFVGYDSSGGPIYQANLTEAGIDTGIILRPIPSFTGNIDLKATLVVTESDGDTKVIEGEIIIKVQPVIDAKDGYQRTSTGNEDSFIEIDWQPADADYPDSDEVIKLVTLSGFPAGSEVRIDGVITTVAADGRITISESNGLRALLSGSGIVEVKPSADDSTDFQLDVSIEVSEDDYEFTDGQAEFENTATTIIHGTVDVVVRPVVESDANLSVTDLANQVTGDAANPIVADANGMINFTINEAKDDAYSVNFTDLDITQVEQDALDKLAADPSAILTPEEEQALAQNPDEMVEELVVDFGTLDQDILDQLVIIGALNNGDGKWVVTDEDDFTIFAPSGLKIAGDGDDAFSNITITFTALVYDQGEEGEQSARVEKQTDVTLRFPENVVANDSFAAEVEVKTESDDIIIGTEDTNINLGQQLLSKGILVTTADKDDVADRLTLVFAQADLQGFTIAGAEFDYTTAEYVFNGSIDENGNVLGLENLVLVPPQDYAGDALLDFRVVTTDSKSGDERYFDLTIPVAISPVVETSQTLTIAVKGTSGLDADFVPIAEGGTEVYQDDIAYEDGVIHLQIGIESTDLDTSMERGVELCQTVMVALKDPSEGVLIDPDGNEVSSFTMTFDANNPNAIEDFLQDVQFKPAENFPTGDGDNLVELTISGTLEDLTNFDQTPGYDHPSNVDADIAFSGELSFEVTPVVDAIIVEGGDRSNKIVITGNEDTPIALDQIQGTPFTVSLKDDDGSEEFISLRISGVPDDFLVSSTSASDPDGFTVKNNGDGFWTIQLNNPSVTSVSFADLEITPAEQFSGIVDLGIIAFTQEKLLGVPVEHNASFTLVVNPVADTVDTAIVDSVSGIESEDIEIKINAQIIDDEYSLAGIVDEESAPEILRVTVLDVPDGASIRLFDGTSFVDNGDGSWTLDINAQQLESIFFNSGDNNATNWNPSQIKIQVQSVEYDVNGVEYTNPAAITEQVVDLTIQEANDQPLFGGVTPIDAIEDNEYIIDNLSISDVDEVDDPDAIYTFIISVESGLLNFQDGAETLFGVQLTPTSDTAATSITIEGTIANINAALQDGVRFNPDSNFNGDVKASIFVDDGGNFGIAAESTENSADFIITVQPENDQSQFAAIADEAVDEEGTVLIDSIQISDIDQSESPTTQFSVTLEVDAGAGNFSFSSAPTGVVVTPATGSLIVLTGTLADINTALATGVQFTPATDVTGTLPVTVTVNDGANGGIVDAGDSSTSNTNQVTFDVVVSPVNDEPIISGASDVTTDEDASVRISGVQIDDPDLADDATTDYVVSIEVTDGQLDFDAVDKTAFPGQIEITNNKIVITGLADDVNTLLSSGVLFSPSSDYTGTVSATVTVSDGGNAGSGGTLTATESFDITVNALNDTPDIADLPPLTTDEDSDLLITNIQISDVDETQAPDAIYNVTIDVDSGQLSFLSDVETTYGITIVTATLPASSVEISGTISQINAALANGINFAPQSNSSGSVKTTVLVEDNGNFGVVNDPKSQTKDFDIEVAAVNDEPITTLPSDITVDEGGTTKVEGIQVSDVDYVGSNANADIEVVLSVDLGTINIATTNSAVTIIDNDSSSVTLSGPIDEVNAVLAQTDALQGVFYTSAQYSNSAELTIVTRDNGIFDDAGTNAQDSDVVTINITPVANAPTLTLNSENQRSLNTVISESALAARGVPLLGLMAALTDASETLSIEVRGLDSALTIQSANGSVMAGNAAGSWVLDAAALNDAVVVLADPLVLPSSAVNFDVLAVSTESDPMLTAESSAISYAVALVVDGGDLDASLATSASTLVDDDQGSRLIGSDFDDELIGGEGNDTLIGGLGSDILTGGDGADMFVWEEVDDSQLDVITDFNLADGDQIDLVGVLDELESGVTLDELLVDFDNNQNLTAAIVENSDDVQIEVSSDTESQSILIKGLNDQLNYGSDPDKDLLTAMFENQVFKYDGN
ncbi:retention module-containing protein [Vibrio neonatus]|uniref:retention module-containing protein n=1 Tax=Vibrio neonatus TaxID=278860 RepID=UPI0021C2FF20|nr:retention module-containing protein [Vibrio neonatus]